MVWARNLNAKPRLMGSFGVLVILMIFASLVSIHSLSESNARLETLYTSEMAGAQQANDFTAERLSFGRQAREAILHSQEPDVVAASEKQMLDGFGRIHAILEAMGTTFYSPEGKAILANMHKDLPAYEEGYHDLYRKLKANDVAGAMTALKTLTSYSDAIGTYAKQAVTLKTSHGQKSFDVNESAFASARMLLICLAAGSATLALMLALFIAKSFALPLEQAVVALERLSRGDLTTSLNLDTKDEVGRMGSAFNQAVEQLNDTMRKVAESASHGSSSSQQLAAAAESIAQGAQNQAAALEETSASLEEITATVRQSADNAQQANQLASGSSQTAEKGQHVVKGAIAAMAEISAASTRIADIISTIDEIAFQTNLLAVNAAVEAARAGDQGRGFAVVATEVRNLAQRSAAAAKEIKSLIQNTLKKVDAGSALVNKSGETLQEIVGSAKRVTDIIAEIAASSAEQSRGVEQVNTAITQMDQVTQANSSQTEELSATAQSLSTQASSLLTTVGLFTLHAGDRGNLYAIPTHRNPMNPKDELTRTPRPAPRAGKPVPAVRPAMALATANDAAFDEC